MFVRKITCRDAKTATKVSKQMENDLGTQISRQTVSRALKNAGMHSSEKRKKPALSSKNIKERFVFAKVHKDWTLDERKRVIWSDESKIYCFRSNGRSWY